MRYVKKLKRKDGKLSYQFNPPEAAIKAGVVKCQTFSDGRTARYEVPRLLEKVDAWKRGDLTVSNLGPSSRLFDIYNHYINTEHFKRLSGNSQKSYCHSIPKLLATKVKQGKTLGDVKINNLSSIFCAGLYEAWVKDGGVATANRWATLLSVIINYGSSLDLIQTNPMAKVRKLSHTPRSEVWSEAQVELFVETAFKEFKWRSMGLLALLCYEWAQRPTDIANLKWDSIDLVRGSVTITQSKRGATVYLPLAKHLEPLLRQQSEDWNFQPWVVPDINRPSGGYAPMAPSTMSNLARTIKDTAGLPNELKIGDLRKSAITEMVSAGVDTSAIMSVSGHKNIQSLNPYLKHTLSAATMALEQRRSKS
jgi:integrase